MKASRRISNVELCKILGYAPRGHGIQNARQYILRKIAKAKGALDKYDPRMPPRGGKGLRSDKRWLITEAALKKICPELVDEQVELGEELKARLAEIAATIDEAFARIEKTAKASRDRDEILANAIRQLRKPGSAA